MRGSCVNEELDENTHSLPSTKFRFSGLTDLLPDPETKKTFLWLI